MSVTQKGHVVTLKHSSGAEAIVHLTGALVVSWKASDGVERLYTSELTPWTQETPVPRGGIPVCYPQFGRHPTPEQIAADPLLAKLAVPYNTQHGGCRQMPYKLEDHSIDGSGACTARFILPRSLTEAMLPSTTAYYIVTLDANTLTTRLSVVLDQSAESSVKVKPGLHPYFLVQRNKVRIEGLKQGLNWTGGKNVGGVYEGGDVTYDDNTGSIARSFQTPGGYSLFVRDGASSFKLRYTGFQDVTTWNTGTEAGTFARGEDFTDMKPEDNTRFICIEPSYRTEWQLIKPGETLNAEMVLEASSS